MAAAIVVASTNTETALLVPENTVYGAVNHKGCPAIRSEQCGWKSAYFIIGVEVAERIAYYGISSNLINYLTGPLGQSTASAAANVNAWSGIASLLPIVGAVIADSFLGRYRTIVVSSIIYILGLSLLTLSATLPSNGVQSCRMTIKNMLCDSPNVQVIAIFFSLYLVAIGQAGHKPCVQAFGADQFDGRNPQETKAKSSFFNWWYFGTCFGPLLVVPALNYVQENFDWSLGFGIPCILMVIALAIFLLGSSTYRYIIKVEDQSALVRTVQVFTTKVRNQCMKQTKIDIKEEAHGILPHYEVEQFGLLEKVVVAPHSLEENCKTCNINEVEEVKAILRLFPIWAIGLVYAIVISQYSTFFTKQGVTMDRSLGFNFSIPAASLQSFMCLSIVVFIPFYDRIFVPIARSLTGKPAGLTMLQRIGTGMFVSIIAMLIAAIVEHKRVKIALEHKLIDLPDATVPMSVWWLIPQFVLFGIADVFTLVGLQEFFYDQVPIELRSVGLSLYLSVFGVGNLLSSLLISIIDKVTSTNGQDSWFANNINKAHLDYFYWLLASLSIVNIIAFRFFTKSYVYNQKTVT